MSKKIFALLLVAVFVLAQFGMASAAPAEVFSPLVILGSQTIGVPAYTYPAASVALPWSFVTNANSAAPLYVYIFTRTTGGANAVWPTASATAHCDLVKTLPTSTVGTQSGSFTLNYAAAGLTEPVAGNTVRFLLWVDDTVTSCAGFAAATAPVFVATPQTTSTYLVTKVAGTIVVDPIAVFSNNVEIDLPYDVQGMPGSAAQYLKIWVRKQAATANAWSNAAGYCKVISLNNTTTAAGETTFAYAPGFFVDQDVAEFYATLDSGATCATSVIPAKSATPIGESFIDWYPPNYFIANPPSLDVIGDLLVDNRVACKTFEMWGLASDGPPALLDPTGTYGYSGFASWNQLQSGSFAAPAPIGDQHDLLSWPITFPATATGAWTFEVDPEDEVGNTWGGASDFRVLPDVLTAEKADCKTFTDGTGHMYELYARYLGDLGLLAGNGDGSYGYDSNLTRAEAAVMFEKANGKTAATLPVAAPSAACTFTDVTATDWFAGWVWQACKDGFVAGIGGGLFDPSNTFTRGQAVTILNNIHMNPGPAGSHFAGYSATYHTVLNYMWGWTPRMNAWTDVAIGAYYAQGVVNAFGVGVIEGTSATTFSPDAPITRGEFAKALYRALSRTW